MKDYTINNERGMAALLSVMVLSMIMVSTLTSIYIYIENRARFQERLRMNYQVGYVMEDMGRSLVQSYDEGVQVIASGGSCPGTSSLKWLDCVQVCAQNTSLLPGVVPSGTPAYAVCVKSDTLNKIVNGADYFCAFNPDGGATPPSYCAIMADNENLNSNSEGAVVAASNNTPEKDSKIENWYARLDNFFDTTIVKNAPVLADKMYPILESKIQPPTMLGWLLPETAYASTDVDCTITPDDSSCASLCYSTSRPAFCKNVDAVITLATIDTGCTPASTDSRCKKCAKNQRNGVPGAGTCMQIAICPPWINSLNCITGGADQRITQMILVK